MRTYLAAERTLLAWIRTGLALMGFGFLVARFGLFLREMAAIHSERGQGTGMSLWLGTTMVGLGVAVNLLAAWHHLPFLRLREGEEVAMRRGRLSILFCLVLAVLGVITA